MNTFFDDYNHLQLKAITSTAKKVCVYAGPGTGKTKTLVGKYIYLQNKLNVCPSSILCLTFTKKAAEEMISRISRICGDNRSKYICTIHSLGNKILSEDVFRLGFPNKYSIINEDEKHIILFTIMSEMNLYEDENITFKDLNEFIINKKIRNNEYIDFLLNKTLIDEKIRSLNEEILMIENPDNIIVLKLEKAFYLYLNFQAGNYYLDYNDLILVSIRLLKTIKVAKNKWANKFSHILIDEFQDLTQTELDLIKILSSVHDRLFVVGDPDQSIYKFRGSDVELFNNFYKTADEKFDFDINYRSYQEIINLSHDVISANTDRVVDIKLKCSKGNNFIPELINTPDRYSEAMFVVEKIAYLIKKQGIKRSDCAILYRNNQCSLVFEEYFQMKKIPYKVYSNNEFFNCDEIKTAISYLKFMVYKDDVSFLNIYKRPNRYISNTMLNHIKRTASQSNVTYRQVIKNDYRNPIFKNNLNLFVSSVNKIEMIDPNKNFEEWCLRVFNETGFLSYIFSTGDEDKVNHIKQLIDMIHSFENEDSNNNVAMEFLNYLALLSDGDVNESEDKVLMMSIHCSKGLEFKYVFLADFNEGYIPSCKAKCKEDFEEERRIAYVAFTRAKDGFYILKSNEESDKGISSFSNSFKKENITNIEYYPKEEKRNRALSIGSYVRNKFYGNGVVKEILLNDKKCVVKFDDYYKEKIVDIDSVISIINKRTLVFDIDPQIVMKIKQDHDIHYELGDIVIHKYYGAGIITKLKDQNNAYIQFRELGSLYDLNSDILIRRNDYIKFIESAKENWNGE